ncbi:MAG: hypothetical protein JKY54_17895 [Flavobacteriales bacterium]|nr:hypothetical protein [Flavobacteriales bacterium]
MKRYSLVIGLIIAVLLSSCSIKQHIHFKKDWSGSIDYNIDMGTLKSMLDQDSTSTAGIGRLLGAGGDYSETIKTLQESSGLSNIVLEEDTVNGTIHLSMDFKDLDVLNDVMGGTGLGNFSGDSSDKGHTYFSLNKNKLTYKMPPISPSVDNGMAGMEAMQSMMTFELKLSFDKKIKKVKTKTTASKSADSKEVIWKPNFEKLIRGEIVGEMVIILEK